METRFTFFIFLPVVTDGDFECVDIFYHAIAFGIDEHAGVACYQAFKTGTYDRRFRTQEWHCLALHV